MSKQRTNKPDEILDAAASLFAQKPFHEVRLDDIAALAQVGKGTVYLYWNSKEEVYLAIVRRGFANILQRLDRELDVTSGVWDKVAAVVRGLVDFAFQHPGVYRIMRSGGMTPDDPELQQMRKRLSDRVTDVLTAGVSSGELTDPHPALTAQYIFSFVRGAVLYPPPGVTPEILVEHVLHVLKHGITARVGS